MCAYLNSCIAGLVWSIDYQCCWYWRAESFSPPKRLAGICYFRDEIEWWNDLSVLSGFQLSSSNREQSLLCFLCSFAGLVVTGLIKATAVEKAMFTEWHGWVRSEAQCTLCGQCVHGANIKCGLFASQKIRQFTDHLTKPSVSRRPALVLVSCCFPFLQECDIKTCQSTLRALVARKFAFPWMEVWLCFSIF